MDYDPERGDPYVHMLKLPNEYPWEWETTFMGQVMMHNYYLYQVIDKVMLEQGVLDNPLLGGIVELGTGSGSLTVILGLWALRLGIIVTTFDNDAWLSSPLHPLFVRLGIQFYEKDVLDRDTAVVAERLNDVPVLLICDNGNKVMEFHKYASVCRSGSVVLCHDYGQEVAYGQLDEFAEKNGYEKYLEDQWMKHNVQVVLYRRK